MSNYGETFMTLEDDNGPILTISAYKIHAVQRIDGDPEHCEVFYSLGGDEVTAVSGPLRRITVKGEAGALGAEVIRKIGMWSGQAA